MSVRHLKLAVALATLVALGVIVYFALPRPVPAPAPVPALACVPPPTPFFASSTNVEVALSETIKVLKAQAEPKVLDVIPKDARTLEMIGFLTCKAREQNLVKTTAELLEYTKLLGDIQSGKTIAPRVRHLGSLANLEKHLRTTPADNFNLVLTDSTGLLGRLEVEELHAKDWPSWFKEFCLRHSACLACNPGADSITNRVAVSVVGKLKVRQADAGPAECTAER